MFVFDYTKTNITNKGKFKLGILYTLIESVKGFQTNFKRRCSRIQSNKVDVTRILNLNTILYVHPTFSLSMYGKVKSTYDPLAHQVGDDPGF